MSLCVYKIPHVRESSPPPDGSSSCNVRRSQSRRFHCRPTARIAAGRDDRVRANLKNPDSSLAPRLIISGRNRHDDVYRVAQRASDFRLHCHTPKWVTRRSLRPTTTDEHGRTHTGGRWPEGTDAHVLKFHIDNDDMPVKEQKHFVRHILLDLFY